MNVWSVEREFWIHSHELNIPRSVCETQSCTVGIRGGNGFLGTSGHRQMMNPSVMNLQHRLVLELSVRLSFDERQADH